MNSDGNASGIATFILTVVAMLPLSTNGTHADELDELIKLQNRVRALKEEGKSREALPIAHELVDRAEQAFPDDPGILASVVGDLAHLYDNQGKYSEAEPLYHRSLKLLEDANGSESSDFALELYNLAAMYWRQGKFAEAEPLYRQSLSISEKLHGGEHSNVALALNGLGEVYRAQGGFTEAGRLYGRALAIFEKVHGPVHPFYSAVLNNVANLHYDKEEYSQAEPLYQRNLTIKEKLHGPTHPDMALGLNNLGSLYIKLERYSDAEESLLRALEIFESELGHDHPSVAEPLHSLSETYLAQQKYSAAEPLIDRAIMIRSRAGVAPKFQSESFAMRSLIAWKQHRHSEAFADLQTAMNLADRQLTQSAGAARERAQAFAGFRNLFERMVRWQNAMGDRRDLTEVLSAIERGRARTLLDDMAHAGANLDAGRSAIERESLQQRELDLKQQIAILEKQLEQDSKSTELQAKLATARQALYDHHRDQRNSSPVYRNLLSTGAGPPRLSQLQRELASDGSLVLIYLLGDEGSYLLSFDSANADLAVLEVDESAAKTLEIEAGPLTADRLQSALHNNQQTGVMQRLSRPETAGDARDQLAALWTTLVPVELRQQILDGRASTENNAGESLTPVRRLVVIPDGPLSLLPFETLVIDPRSDDPTYLLDVGPPIHYSPSATVLYNLIQRRTAQSSSSGPQLLTVGDPNYAGGRQVASSNSESILDVLTPRSRYHGVGGQLSRLPNSGTEVRWVSSVFDKAGISGVTLTGAKATESEVRGQLNGRRFIHLACHGLVDHNFGNLFGALAFSAGSNASQEPGDDGFLTLAEMHGLDLNACELAILSACQTNYGPQQKGEGVWAISRGFLVAGARRVVASNWLVDDEAAASLVSYFCGGVANAIGKEQDPDYAGSLQAAKRWVRNQEKWSSPYYWGTFVLVGPE